MFSTDLDQRPGNWGPNLEDLAGDRAHGLQRARRSPCEKRSPILGQPLLRDPSNSQPMAYTWLQAQLMLLSTFSAAMGSKTIQLNSKHWIPVVGFGVYQSRPGQETKNAVAIALRDGYRYGVLVALGQRCSFGSHPAPLPLCARCHL